VKEKSLCAVMKQTQCLYPLPEVQLAAFRMQATNASIVERVRNSFLECAVSHTSIIIFGFK
jgi:hypothetical protein